MKIVIAPDSFKESLTALQVAAAIEAGMRDVWPHADYVKLPVADGGEGTVQAMIDATGGQRIEARVTGPLGAPLDAFYGRAGALAIIEMAAASGLESVPPARRDPLTATSRGTGELIRLALDAGARRFVLGVGGSATNDGGAGMLQALGVRLLDAEGRDIGPGGGALAALARIDASGLDARVRDSRFQIACDVSNPLVGARGASAVFGPQKGATPAMVATLDANLAHFAAIIRRDLGQDIADVPGAGAGGGIAAAMVVFLRGRLRPGIEIVTEAVGLDAAVQGADLVVTGEGRIDGQTVNGKTPMGVARVAARHGVPVIAIGGGLAADAGAVHAHGIAAVFAAVNRPCTLAEALAGAADNLRSAARNVAAALQLGTRLGAGAPPAARGADAVPTPARIHTVQEPGPSESTLRPVAPDDEAFWAGIRAQYAPSPAFINLENGYFGMPANPVRAALRRYQDEVDADNSLFLRARWPARLARVRALLADFTGVGADELLVTRSAVESLNILLQGYPFGAGDGLLMASHDYDSAHDIVHMLAARRGIDVARLDVPPDPADDAAIVALYAAAITPRTRVLLLTHIVHRTGRIMPVAALAAMARARGLDVIVDAAHSLAQLDYTVPQLGAQFAAFNLHKWVGAPLGTGLLYIARARIADIVPLFGDTGHAPGDIDKLGHFGAVPPAPIMAVEDALAFHRSIGTANKEARLRWLARRWMDAVRDLPRVRLHTPRDPRRHCALGAFAIDGMAPAETARRLMDDYGIFTVVRCAGGTDVVRVTPHLHTGPGDVDALAAAIRALAREGA